MRLLVFAALVTLFVLVWGQGPKGEKGIVGDQGICVGCPDVVSHLFKLLPYVAKSRKDHTSIIMHLLSFRSQLVCFTQFPL